MQIYAALAESEHNENTTIERIYVDRLLDGLTAEEREIARGYMAGYTWAELGADANTYRTILHKLAVRAGAEWHCDKCDTDKPAADFYYSRRNVCRECMKAPSKARQRRTRGEPLPSHIEHGKASTYTGYGCRCDECRAAKREYSREYYRRAKAQAASA